MLMKNVFGWSVKKIEDCYNKALKTKDIIVDGNGFISFTKFFKYLGSFISYDLSGEYDDKVRMKKTNQRMSALKNIWEEDEVDLLSE